MTFKLNKNKLKILMLDNNITAKELAEATQTNVGTISRIFNTEKECNIKTINKIAEALKVKPSELIEEQ